MYSYAQCYNECDEANFKIYVKLKFVKTPQVLVQPEFKLQIGQSFGFEITIGDSVTQTKTFNKRIPYSGENLYGN